MELILAGKSDISFKRLSDRKKRGFNYIELFIDETSLSNEYEEYINKLNESKVKVCSIHVPHYMTTREGKKAVCSVGAKDNWQRQYSTELIYKTIELADRIIPKTSNSRIVVVHPATNILLSDINKIIEGQNKIDKDSVLIKLRSEMLTLIEENLKLVLADAEKKGITICLENMPLIHPFNWGRELSQVYLACRFTEDIVKIVNKLNSPFLLATVDLAHLITVKNCFKFCSEMIENNFFLTKNEKEMYHSYSINDYIADLKKAIGSVHLSFAQGIGEVYLKHGIPWPLKEKNLLESVLRTLKSICFRGPIIIEINELDLDFAVGSEATLLLLKEIMDKISYE